MYNKKGVSGNILKRLFLCPWMGGILQGARKAVQFCPWMGGIPQGVRTAMRFCPWMGGILQRASTAVRYHLLAALLSCLCSTAVSAQADIACAGVSYDDTSRVKYIHDGDTLHLIDGRKIRLIGINTPELAHDDRSAEPFSSEAKKALKSMFREDKKISLIYGSEKQDRYKRVLAHAFTSDGINIQADLLTQGVARAISFPPNTRYSNCYQQQERRARCNKTGLWKTAQPIQANNLGTRDTGFQLVTGKLENININNKGIWLTLGHQLTVGIRPENQPLFDVNALYELLDKNIVVRGWINKSKKNTPYYIRVRHPSSIQSATAFTCN